MKVKLVSIAASLGIKNPYVKYDLMTVFKMLSIHSSKYSIVDNQLYDIAVCVDSNLLQYMTSSIRNQTVRQLLIQYGNRLRVYDCSDNPLASLCGGYTSLTKVQSIPGFNCCVPYVKNHSSFSPNFRDVRRKLQWSFTGGCGPAYSSGHNLRRNILKLSGEDIVLVDSTELPNWIYDNDSLQKQQAAADQMESILGDSKYVACPRGNGPASFRFYESICCGAVPVVLSDDWLLPDVPLLNESIIHIKESDFMRISDRIDSDKCRYNSRRHELQNIYTAYFAESKIFDTVVSMVSACKWPCNSPEVAIRIINCQLLVQRIARKFMALSKFRDSVET
jgi:hypothetical protein